jgi:lipopolysaccharide heptosyltransferase I
MLHKDWSGRVLILKPSSLGDIVHALPVLSALRRACPKARITWMVRNELAGLFDCVSGLDEVLLFDRRTLGRWYSGAAAGALRTLLRTLRQGRYDLVLDLQGLLRSALLARFSGCRIRIGLAEAREGAGFFYTHTAFAPDSPHIIDYYQEVLKIVGVDLEPVEFGIQPSLQARQAVSDLLRKDHLQPKQFAVLVPGSAHERKCWPADRFARVAEFLHQEAGLGVVAAGSQKEKAIISKIVHLSKTPIVDFAGRTTLSHLAALFEQALLVIGNDTGPTHMAAAMDVSSLVIFGPTNPARLGPYQKPDAVAAVDPFARGRTIDHRDPKYRIENVTLEMVLEKIGPILSSPK